LGLLPYPEAATTWAVLELLFLADVTVIILWPSVRWNDVILMTCGLALWPVVRSEIASGQLMLAILLGLTVMYVALKRDQDALAGVALGVTFLLKPIAWPLLFLGIKRPRMALVALFVGFTGYLVAGLVIGPERLTDYFTRILPVITAYYQNEPINYSLWTIGARLWEGLGPGTVTNTSIAPILAYSHNLVAPTTIIALCVAAIVGWEVTMRSKGLEVPVATLTCLAILLSPLSWSYYFVLAVLPIAIALRLGDTTEKSV
jgi:hypothetical protein